MALNLDGRVGAPTLRAEPGRRMQGHSQENFRAESKTGQRLSRRRCPRPDISRETECVRPHRQFEVEGRQRNLLKDGASGGEG